MLTLDLKSKTLSDGVATYPVTLSGTILPGTYPLTFAANPSLGRAVASVSGVEVHADSPAGSRFLSILPRTGASIEAVGRSKKAEPVSEPPATVEEAPEATGEV